MTDTTTRTSQRYWEIDSLRGIAIIMMVLYHLLWDLLLFNLVTDITLQAGFWKYFQRTTASLFIILVGVSLAVSSQRRAAMPPFRTFFGRGVKIFGWGLVITVIVQFANMGRIDFGVLHLIGFSIIAAYPFLRYRWLNIGLWAGFNILGFVVQQNTIQLQLSWPPLRWLSLASGIQQPTGFYLDYFPVIPWFGVVLLGIGVGNLLYMDGRVPKLLHPQRPLAIPIAGLQWLGQHSLVIYLLHQPILFGVLWVLYG